MNTRQTAILISAEATYAAMMAANAAEETAPQDSVYGMLSDALRATLRLFYGAADAPAVRRDAANYADHAYSVAIISGELTAETVALAEAQTEGERTTAVCASALQNGDIMTDPNGNLRVSDVTRVGAHGVALTVTSLDGAWTDRWSMANGEYVAVLCG